MIINTRKKREDIIEEREEIMKRETSLYYLVSYQLFVECQLLDTVLYHLSGTTINLHDIACLD